MYHDSTTKILGQVLLDRIREILYFPIWWYSKGLLKVINGAGEFVKGFEQTLGLMIWIKNLFVPMFGQKDIAGRLISFGLRLFQIFWKSIVLLIFILIAFLFVIFWLALPVLVIYQIIIHI
ncbi:MAG: hypothetical protein WC460_01910 [Patescibacteria group bacterium]